MKSILTDYTEVCAVCGSKEVEEHHLVFGSYGRKLSTEHQLVLPLCRYCHSALHTTQYVAAEFSKMLGQLAFEKKEVANGLTEQEARDKFIKTFGRAYL